jgi:hypothetical protein
MSKTIKIIALDSMVGNDFVYNKGGEYDAPEDRAKDLVKAGLAKLASPAKPDNAMAKPIIETRKGKK